MGKNKLKIYIHTNQETNKHVEEVLCKMIAESIYNSKEFQELLTPIELKPAN